MFYEAFQQPYGKREATTFCEEFQQSSKIKANETIGREATTVSEKYKQTSLGKVNEKAESETTKFTDHIQQSAFTKCASTVQSKISTLDTCVYNRSFSHDVCPLCGNAWDGIISQGSQNRGLCQNHFHPETTTYTFDAGQVTNRCSAEVTYQRGQSSEVQNGHQDCNKSGTADNYRYDQTDKAIDQDEFPIKVPVEIGKLDEKSIENMIAILIEADQIFREQPRTGDPKNQQFMQGNSNYPKTKEASRSRNGLKDLPSKDETRRLVLEHCVKYFEMKISESVRFAKKIPGFTALPLEDQANLIRDRCKLQAREEVEDLHNCLMSCLIHVIKKHGTESISRRLGHLTDVLCSCRNVTEVDLVQVKKIFLEWPNYSQYKLVEEFLD